VVTTDEGPIILASSSPRRRDILSDLGIAFEVQPSHADESALHIEDHVEFVRAAALLKLRSVLDASDRRGAFVLAADTTVSVGDQRLGKPCDDRDAVRMLTLLAGRDHVVRTAIALGVVGEDVREARVVETRVWFRQASSDELERYVATGESRDKAGAYGIQGVASGFVTRVDGSYSNVVGLPAAEVVELLTQHGALDRWP
jgi:septum formation protein